MQYNPLVSIIIPCYNCTSTIHATISSVAKQTYKNIEIICINDYSSDGTDLTLEEIRQNIPIVIFTNEKNSGPGVSRNNGIALAQGEMIAFIDADDTYEPNFIEDMVNTHLLNNADIVICNGNRIADGKVSDLELLRGLDKNNTKNDIIALSRSSLCVMLINKKLFNKVYLPEMYNAEDVATIPLLMSKANRIEVLDKRLYNYVYNTDSLSNKKNPKVYKNFIKAFDIIEKGIEDYEVLQFIYIKNILYGVVLNAFKNDVSIREVRLTLSEYTRLNKQISKNKYFRTLSIYKQIFVWCASKKIYVACYIMSKLHKYFL